MTKLTTGSEKDFEADLFIIRDLLDRGEPFAFSRFSDGEVFMLQGMEIQLAQDFSIVGPHFNAGTHYAQDDWKHYQPSEHEFFRQKLEDSLRFRKDNYYKGLSCRCCIGGGGEEGQRFFDYQLSIVGEGDEHNLTWANLLINSNYLLYLDNIVPILQRKRVVMVVNELADTRPLGMDIRMHFRIGPNCIVNNYGVIDEIKEYISREKIDDHVFLVAASSLTNMINHQAFSEFDGNTFIDIGSSLNPFMPGINSRRGYMDQVFGGARETRKCIW